MRQTQPRLELLLATCNSAHFLGPLLDSLLAQTDQDFSLVVSDDHSDDETRAILTNYAARFRHPPRIVERQAEAGSPMANFAFLLENARAPYTMLVDHDDVWHADKIARGLAGVQAVERARGSAHPVLAHGDLAVIDAAGNPVAPSFWAMKQIAPPCSTRLNRALIHAAVVGCTVTLNRALIDAAVPIPEQAVMHDWWLNLIAAASGTVVYDDRPAIDYRIHATNASHPAAVSAAKAAAQRGRRNVLRTKIARRAGQAAALAQHLQSSNPAASATARSFAELGELGWAARRTAIIRHRFLFPGMWRNLAMLAVV